MEKKFLEAFPNLQLNGTVKDLFEQVVVEKITTTKRKDFLRIYIRSERLIEKEQVYEVEKEIKKQFFANDNIVIKIYEKFILSEQYNPQMLMELYKESILLELRETEHMLYTMFRQAELSFPTEHMLLLTLEDSVIAKSKEDELIHILDKVLNERCGFQVKFDIAYKEASESKYKEEDELRIQKVVEGITRRMENVGEEQPEQIKQENKSDTSVKNEKTAKTVAAASFQTERKSEKSFAAKKAEGFQRRYPKKSDNPDVIYGRDFDEEAMEIKEIWGEMGEVVIRGKVRALDKREIRNEKTIVSFEITDFTDTIKVKMFVHNEQLR